MLKQHWETWESVFKAASTISNSLLDYMKGNDCVFQNDLKELLNCSVHTKTDRESALLSNYWVEDL